MSLEVTVLKTRHSGVEEAEKIRPYIEKADIFALESATSTLQDANAMENKYNMILRDRNHTPSSLEMDFLLGCDPNNSVKYNIDQYNARALSIVYENRVPLIVLERFSDAQSRQLREDFFHRHSDEEKAAIQVYLDGDKEEGLQKIIQANQIYFDVLTIRDEHIAKNISPAMKRIKKKYGKIKPKGDKLNLTIQIGADHKVEDFVKQSCEAILLTDLSERKVIEDMVSKLQEPNCNLERDVYPIVDQYIANRLTIRVEDYTKLF